MDTENIIKGLMSLEERYKYDPANLFDTNISKICFEAIEKLNELKEYEDLGLTAANIKEIDRLYSEQAKELMEYRKAEKEGLLLRLPCKVGDEVYYILQDNVDEDNVNGYVVSNLHKIVEISKNGFFTGSMYDFPYTADFTKWDEIGKTVFFTKSEAEAKLKEFEGENEDSN